MNLLTVTCCQVKILEMQIHNRQPSVKTDSEEYRSPLSPRQPRSPMATEPQSSSSDRAGATQLNISNRLKSSSVLQLDELIREKERQLERKELRVSVMIAIILIVFLLCTLPSAILMEIDSSAERFPWVTIICYIVSWMVGVTNPLVYVLFSQSYRNAAATKMRGFISNTLQAFRKNNV